jgi:hypothetical protein
MLISMGFFRMQGPLKNLRIDGKMQGTRVFLSSGYVVQSTPIAKSSFIARDSHHSLPVVLWITRAIHCVLVSAELRFPEIFHLHLLRFPEF